MDVTGFNQRVKHGRLDFHPKLIYGFEDPDAVPYFRACGWTTDVPKDAEPDVVITMDELDIDPLTIWGHDSGDRKRGQFVMPERAAAHLNEQHPHLDYINEEWARNYVATFVPGEELLARIAAEEEAKADA